MASARRSSIANPAIIAIPARNEKDRIATCLLALSQQIRALKPRVLILLMDSGDQTAALARSCAALNGLAAEVVERQFAPAKRSAGHARRLAMALTAERIGPGGVM